VTVENASKLIEAKEEQFLKNIEEDGTLEGDILGSGDLGEGSKIPVK